MTAQQKTELIQRVDEYHLLSQETQEKIKEYIEWNPQFSKEHDELKVLLQSVDNRDSAERLEKRFLERLQFGTAGIRGPMGCGYNCINDLIVIQTSQGLASYLIKTYSTEQCEKRGIVIGFDGRHGSMRYAHAVAAVFLSKNFKVYLTSEVVPTPIIPFAITIYKNLCGIQITASHNPKNDNGYKVYLENGAQIIPPIDEKVSSNILASLKPWDEALSLLDLDSGLLKKQVLAACSKTGVSSSATVKSHYKLFDYYTEITDKYVATMSQQLCFYPEVIQKSKLKFIYTPIHGVGYAVMHKLISSFGLSDAEFIVVQEQCNPDPDFPTVNNPNPEELCALIPGMKFAEKEQIRIILANDPDADRFGCAERQPNGQWKAFTGDELGILFASYMLENMSRSHNKSDLLFLCSAVSSQLLKHFARIENVQFAETATGFKWIMNKALEIVQKSKAQFCFAYEEALGFAVSLAVPDKDGMSACAVFVEMICRLSEQNMTLVDKLEQLYDRYGYSVISNAYLKYQDPDVVRDIFKEFRNDGNYQKALGDSEINRIRDVTMQFDNGNPDNACYLPYTPGSEMITLYFKNDVTITFRTSGTEPKLKYYSELITPNKADAQVILEKTLKDTFKYFVQLERYRYHLQPAPTALDFCKNMLSDLSPW